MAIERKGDWILVYVNFLIEGSPDYKEMDLEELEETEPCIFRFNIHHLSFWNKGNEENPTVIGLISGERFNLTTPFEEFDKFILEQNLVINVENKQK